MRNWLDLHVEIMHLLLATMARRSIVASPRARDLVASNLPLASPCALEILFLRRARGRPHRQPSVSHPAQYRSSICLDFLFAEPEVVADFVKVRVVADGSANLESSAFVGLASMGRLASA